MTSRLAPLEAPFPATVQEDFDQIMRGRPPLELFKVLAHSPRVLRKMRLGGLLDRGPVSLRHREIVILRTTGRLRSEYEWGVHVDLFAQRAELTAQQRSNTLDAVVDASLWSEEEQSILALVDELIGSATLSDALWSRLAAAFSSEQLVELVALVGYYQTISYYTRAFAVPVERGATRFPA
jgi:alkylhydroperoxidase family enzyme